ncbi:hypothetical protein FKM82_005414 [Ascaphus truei]
MTLPVMVCFHVILGSVMICLTILLFQNETHSGIALYTVVYVAQTTQCLTQWEQISTVSVPHMAGCLSCSSTRSERASAWIQTGVASGRPIGAGSCVVGSSPGVIAMEGPLRRKTLLKEGKKPTLSSWTRYWVTLSGSTLMYFGAKSLRGNERKNYKSTPSKKVSVVSWMVVLPDDPEHPNIFQLNNPDKGNVYKFQTGSRFHAILWHKHLDDACKSSRPQAPANLMSFE